MSDDDRGSTRGAHDGSGGECDSCARLRQLRDDLHDVLGPTVCAVLLRLDTLLFAFDNGPQAGDRSGSPAPAPNLAPARAGPSRDALLVLRAEVSGLVGQVRSVMTGIPETGSDDLQVMLRELAVRLDDASGGVLHITVEVAPGAATAEPGEQQVVARIASEAMVNFAQHAGSGTCTVHVWSDEGLWVEVGDDGSGLNNRPSGVGLSSMKHRAYATGGSCTVHDRTDGPGVIVKAFLPRTATADQS